VVPAGADLVEVADTLPDAKVIDLPRAEGSA
jgi:hypothetical protein